jgi:predicted TIM-barrel enzyme
LNREDILARLRAKVDNGEIIVAGGAGTGLSAKSEEAGGIDMIVVYNSGRYRMAGRGSLAGLLAYGNANQIVREMADEVLTVVERVPVLAGVNGTDPFMNRRRFLKELQELGFSGIQNFPTVGLIDGVFRENLEETGMGFYLEVECIAEARNLGLLTTPYVFDVSQTREMICAGADILVAHMGLTTSGSIGARTAKTLDHCCEEIQAIIDAATQQNPDILILCHGGPIAEPEDVQFIFDRVHGLHGFYGASSMERLPSERALKHQVEQFCSIEVRNRNASK